MLRTIAHSGYYTSPVNTIFMINSINVVISVTLPIVSFLSLCISFLLLSFPFLSLLSWMTNFMPNPNPHLHIRPHHTFPPCARFFVRPLPPFCLPSLYHLRHCYHHHRHRFHTLRKSNADPFHVIIDIIIDRKLF